jgi:oligogalacturonide lyase
MERCQLIFRLLPQTVICMRYLLAFAGLMLMLLGGCKSMNATTQPTTKPSDYPRTWIDPDTGHRVHRLSDEPGSGGIYFNFSAFTPDGKEMVYSAPAGPRVINLETKKTRQIVEGTVRIIGIGRKTPTLYFSRAEDRGVYSANINTGEVKKVASLESLPPSARLDTINADETLIAGTYLVDPNAQDYGAKKVIPQGLSGPGVQPMNKAQMMEERFNAKFPLVLFTVNAQTGEIKKVLDSTDWVNHLLFSPTEPTLLMYCHEGPWHKLDRIWTIRTDGSDKQQIHHRTMAMEIWGHEFWGLDGKTIWYDLQTPKGEDFWLAAFNTDTKERRWYHMQRDEWSVHFNITADESLMCGDGGDPKQVAQAKNGQWIYLFRPELMVNKGVNNPEFVKSGVLRSEKLVNMSKHWYKQEPNVRFSPDKKMVFFTGNFHGESFLYGVEVERAK